MQTILPYLHNIGSYSKPVWSSYRVLKLQEKLGKRPQLVTHFDKGKDFKKLMPSGQSQVLGHMLLNTLEHLPFK